jgi:hypothetical protein
MLTGENRYTTGVNTVREVHMWRTRAVVSMLVEDVAGLGPLSPEDRESADSPAHPESEALTKAIRRATLVVAVDCLAILILFLFRDHAQPFLPAEPTVETVFTFGVLAVAAHAGFRWAQLERLRSVQRLCDDLRQRQDA